MDKERNLYKDIQARTDGEIYIGVVGPVRSGKSTFIKRFMDVCVLPNMDKEYEKKQAVDELPQSGTGKTITTTEPKFIPSEAAEITFGTNIKLKSRLIDCVGYMVEGAVGHMEEDSERMVKTPWFDYEIPFTQAAELGTHKVIAEHSTIGIVVTTDGSFSDIPAENYEPALEKTLLQLKQIHKPFVVLLNCEKPFTDTAKQTADSLAAKYGVAVIPVNCAQLKREDIHMIMEKILLEFPLSSIAFYMPKWVEMLSGTHPLKQSLLSEIRDKMANYSIMRDIQNEPWELESEYVNTTRLDGIDMADGSVRIYLDVDDKYYYDMLSELLQKPVESEYELLEYLKETAQMQREYTKVLYALDSVRHKGYGVVTPDRSEISLDAPEVIRHGNKYGVKIRAQSPSIHMIRANIETEIAPIVGTKEQAEDLISYISKEENGSEGMWETNIFGKTVEQMVQDGIGTKIAMIGDESQLKLQDTMQKIVNDSNGGLVCIII